MKLCRSYVIPGFVLALALMTMAGSAFGQTEVVDPQEQTKLTYQFNSTVEFLVTQKILKSPQELLAANPRGFVGSEWSNKKTKLYGKFLEQEVAISTVSEDVIAALANTPRTYKERLQRARFVLDANQGTSFIPIIFMNGVPQIGSTDDLKNQLDTGWSVLRGQEDNRTEFFLGGLDRIFLALIGDRSSTFAPRTLGTY